MGLSASRALLYFFGILLVVVALAVFFFATGLDRWVPVSLLAAGVLLIIGLAVMSFADSAPSDNRQVTHGHHDDGDVTIVKK